MAVALAFAFTLAACSSSPKVSRRDVDETIDLSGRWNDTDSRLVSEEMIRDALSWPWIGDHRQRAGQKPRVIVGSVRNESHEHINTETFVKDLERALIKSGQVSFVASRDQRGEIRAEREDQGSYASLETMKSMGKELGADYMLVGSINTILDATEGDEVRFYQVDLEMISIETNEKVWIGDKKVKKLIERRRLGW
ncbi:MAG: penicillin-binding protein activator LpoB [Myxococcota bacterium]